MEKLGVQSTALRDTSNTITISLMSTVFLPSGLTILLQGLKETNTAAATLNVLMNVTSVYSITAAWNTSGTVRGDCFRDVRLSDLQSAIAHNNRRHTG
eukprot:758965-Hanusia_phi.AAC.5